ncbi:MAG: response regulator [candidate division NC10 bacterium]|nr:response regulator [candidate division NC10 bacterium]
MPGETVLIVEDDDSLRVALADALAGLGYEIIEAATGAEALALATRRVPDLILLDLGLPDLDGLSVARKLREKPQTAGIVVAALTAEEISGERAEEVYKHCIGYIPKPVGLDRLAQNVALFLRIGRPRAKIARAAALADDHPKRRHPRFNVEIGALCRFRGSARQGGGVKVAGLVRNLSEGGLRLELPQMHPRGVLAEISFRTDDARILAVAEVVWTGAPETVQGVGQVFCHGLRFVRMAQDQRNAIRRFIVKRFTT